VTSAAERWSGALDQWALPPQILDAAEQSPWVHPPELFDVPDVIEDTPSHEAARAALPDGGVVLDVGCGGGVAAFALAPPAARVVGVDAQPAMLELFSHNARRRHVEATTVEGSWPAVADSAPVADVVTAHHVVYNVGDIVPFLDALTAHARQRVVLELPDHHPLTPMADAWRHFWQLDRPTEPTSTDLLDVLTEMGINPVRVAWAGPLRSATDLETAARHLRIRLCLPAAREGEVREFVAHRPAPAPRPLSTIWWDV